MREQGELCEELREERLIGRGTVCTGPTASSQFRIMYQQ